jgi:tetraacyldisaccharide 4'-kinase
LKEQWSKQMPSEIPPFWWNKNSWQAVALWPISKLYGAIATRRMKKASPPLLSFPVICVGNLTVGGGGKTPTALALAKTALLMGLNPGIVSRGYGGTHKSVHRVDPHQDLAKHVGDEPLLMAQYAPVVVCINRHEGAVYLQKQGCNFIIMDDGFQSMRLKSDFNLIVVDARRGVGNGHVLPSGPLRAPIIEQLQFCDAIVKTGMGYAADTVIRMAARAAKPIYSAKPIPDPQLQLRNKRVFAFAGIADPEKFFETLTNSKAIISLTRTWPDHHYFDDDELKELIQTSQDCDLTLVTTQKDAMRLTRTSAIATEILEKAIIVCIDMTFDQSNALELIITQTLQNFKLRQF